MGRDLASALDALDLLAVPLGGRVVGGLFALRRVATGDLLDEVEALDALEVEALDLATVPGGTAQPE